MEIAYTYTFNSNFDHYTACQYSIATTGVGIKCPLVNAYLIQNSQAVKKVCSPQKGYGEKRCEIQGGGQEMAVMVGQW